MLERPRVSPYLTVSPAMAAIAFYTTAPSALVSIDHRWIAELAVRYPKFESRLRRALSISRERLEAMIGLTETTDCRTRALLACFGEQLPEPCGHCDNCTTPAATFDGTVAAQKVLSAIYRTGATDTGLKCQQTHNVIRV